MNRRDAVLALIALGAVTKRSIAQQQSKVWKVGFLSQRHMEFIDSDYYYGPFRQGMRELGYVEGRNLIIEWRSAEGNAERLPGLAAELASMGADAIVTPGTPATLAAQKATATIPIIMVGTADPIGSRLVRSLARPGGNITGLSNLTGDSISKLLELLLTTAPKISRVALLGNPSNISYMTILKSVQASAQRVGVTIVPVEAQHQQDIESAFSTMARQNAGGLIVPLEPLFQQQKKQIAELAMKYRLPSVSNRAEYADSGGVMTYGENGADSFRRAATYVDKILKGTKPGDLPVEQPTIFELVVNLKAARSLGLTIPQSILIRADRVIE